MKTLNAPQLLRCITPKVLFFLFSFFEEYVTLAVCLACRFQFFQRTQLQTARPTIPTNTPSIRPGSQPPTAAVYPANQPIMMAMAPMPFPSPQAAQYYIPQVTHPLTSVVIESIFSTCAVVFQPSKSHVYTLHTFTH